MQFGLSVDSRLQFGAQLQQQQCDEHEHEHRFPPSTQAHYDRAGYGLRGMAVKRLEGSPIPSHKCKYKDDRFCESYQGQASELKRRRTHVEHIRKIVQPRDDRSRLQERDGGKEKIPQRGGYIQYDGRGQSLQFEKRAQIHGLSSGRV